MSDVVNTQGGAPLLNERKNYWTLDIVKFICALFIISAHFASEWGHFPTVIDYAFSIYIIAVPFFFACSGFLFFVKLNSIPTKEGKFAYFIKYEKRIWIMYGLWTAIYFIYSVIRWGQKGILNIQTFLNWLHSALVFQTFSTIWFLPALAVGIAIAYFLVTRLTKKQMIALCVVLYIFGMFGYTYSFVFEGTFVSEIYRIYHLIFKTTRNGLFNAVPFIYMGYLATAQCQSPSRDKAIKYGALAGASLVLMVAESFILKLKFNVTGMDIGVFVAVFTYFLLMTALNIDIKERPVFAWFRKLSILIFVSQRIFLTVLPGLLPGVFNTLYANSYIGMFIVIGLTVAFSVGIILLSKKVSFLKKFY